MGNAHEFVIYDFILRLYSYVLIVLKRLINQILHYICLLLKPLFHIINILKKILL